ncbi:type VII secretion integral membrane protein EccD [uncultured Corynebacterium sp.]|uniref:type VII secretion integral membrane protein EccD n=1 Tax=uncultured Corynebacterium sp. TaxID=159447 RepID=UPI0028892DB6|nr:type VII secretion integral membrane protein EccD [uncultured Corynebacterium sp.]
MKHAPSIAPTQSVRLTVRFNIGEFRKEADVCLPLNVSIGEALGELLLLVDAPIFTVPLQASTAGGKAIALSTALERTPLHDGSLLLIEQVADKPAPIVRDAAEALAHDAADAKPARTATLWASCGLLGASCIIAALAGLAAAAAACALGAFALALWTRSTLITSLFILAASTAGWLFVAPAQDEMPWGIWAACAGALLALCACHMARLGGTRLAMLTISAAILFAVGAAGSYLPGAQSAGLAGPTAPEVVPAAGAACLLLAMVFALANAASLSTHLAGLKVPQLPTAGQSLNVSDSVQSDVDARAQRAGLAYEGICIGAAIAGIPSLMVVAGMPLSRSDAIAALFAQLLCLTLAGATVLHSVRHARVVSSWALSTCALAAATAAVVLVGRGWQELAHPAPWSLWVMSVLGFIIVAAMASTPLWSHKVAAAEPTTIAWYERAETIAVAACLPLAAHVAGLFFLIRGLG